MTRSSSADEFQPDALTRKVLNLDVTFHWIGGSDRFWFRRQTRSGEEFIIVDAETGQQSLAFDTASMRTALNAARPGTVDDPSRLPIRALRIESKDCLVVETPSATFAYDISLNACRVRSVAKDTGGVASPDGRHTIVRRQDDLWLRNVSGGEERRLTHDSEPNFGYGDVDPSYDRQVVARRRAGDPSPLRGVIWSPNSRFIVALRQDLRAFPERLFVTEYALADAAYAYAHHRRTPIARDREGPRSQLALLDIESSSVRAIGLDAQALNDLALPYLIEGVVWWTENFTKLFLITANRGGSSFALCSVEVATGLVREILRETAEHNVRLNPFDYARPNVHVTSDGAEIIWYSERSGYGHLYLYDAKSGRQKRQITQGNWAVFDLLRVDELARIAYFTAGTRADGGNPYYRHLYRVKLDGGEPELLTPETADHKFENVVFVGAYRLTANGPVGPPSGSSISPTGRYFVDSYSTTDRPPEYVLRTISGVRVSHLLTSDASDLYAAGWLPPERVVAKAADGTTDIYGVMTLPRDFDPNRKYPVIDSMYPGPQRSSAPRTFMDQLAGGAIHHLQTFADAGFIVVAIDARGTAHRSRAFRDTFLGTEDVFGAADHVAAIQSLAATRSYMDLDRVGVRGQSFGGYGALRAMLLFPDFFKVAVSATGPAGYLDAQGQTNVERFFGVPSASSEAAAYYETVSNVRLVSRLKGRLLLIYGGIDESVPLKQAFVMFDAFIKADKDVDMLIVPDSAHSAPALPYVIRRSVQYFQEHLAGYRD